MARIYTETLLLSAIVKRLTPEGQPQETRKAAYVHAFVVLAAASATAAGRPGGRDLLEDSLSVVDRRFWSEAEGRSLESW